MSYKKVVAVQNESSDWYVIPAELASRFFVLSDEIEELMEKGTEDVYVLITEFENEFGQYATGGDVNNIQLYIK